MKNIILQVQCRKCTAFTILRKCLLRPDLKVSLHPGRKRHCELSDQWIKKLAKNFVGFTNKEKTTSFSLRQLTGSQIKLQLPLSHLPFFTRLFNVILNAVKNLIRLIRGKK